MSPDSSHSKYEAYQFVALGSRLGQRIPIYQQLAGADPDVSMQIAFFLTLGAAGLVDLDTAEMAILMKLLNAKRQALFATSEKVNEISKMSMQLPSDDEDVSLRRDSDEVPEPPV
jgi:hypothetical protein